MSKDTTPCGMCGHYLSDHYDHQYCMAASCTGGTENGCAPRCYVFFDDPDPVFVKYLCAQASAGLGKECPKGQCVATKAAELGVAGEYSPCPTRETVRLAAAEAVCADTVRWVEAEEKYHNNRDQEAEYALGERVDEAAKALAKSARAWKNINR